MNQDRANELKPVFLAFCEGKKIQYKAGNGEWKTTDHPSFSDQYQYRIAPEIKFGWVNVYPVSNLGKSADAIAGTFPNGVGTGLIFETRERADGAALGSRIGCCEIFWEE